ncbi:MAG: CDP-alcohol phosphatidyltransferase family protein [Rhizobiaceae bacterium]|nr:CDP-alcohol phosphatidyltransferase family protein [Rhizobiaceae bacterium]
MTIPNIITVMRFLLVPGVIYALLLGEMQWAFTGFLIAGISDGVDGYIARRFDQASKLGAYLDPIADKLLLVSVFIVLGVMQHLPLWLVVLAVSRDALIVVAVMVSSVMAHPVTVRPLMVSKVNTAVQIGLAVVILAELAFSRDFGWLDDGLVYLCGALTVASAAAYLLAWLRHMNGYGEDTTA